MVCAVHRVISCTRMGADWGTKVLSHDEKVPGWWAIGNKCQDGWLYGRSVVVVWTLA